MFGVRLVGWWIEWLFLWLVTLLVVRLVGVWLIGGFSEYIWSFGHLVSGLIIVELLVGRADHIFQILFAWLRTRDRVALIGLELELGFVIFVSYSVCQTIFSNKWQVTLDWLVGVLRSQMVSWLGCCCCYLVCLSVS